MCDKHNCQAQIGVQITKQFHDLCFSFFIQVAGGFIRQQQPRLVNERSSYDHTLLLSRGELARIDPQFVG